MVPCRVLLGHVWAGGRFRGVLSCMHRHHSRALLHSCRQSAVQQLAALRRTRHGRRGWLQVVIAAAGYGRSLPLQQLHARCGSGARTDMARSIRWQACCAASLLASSGAWVQLTMLTGWSSTAPLPTSTPGASAALARDGERLAGLGPIVLTQLPGLTKSMDKHRRGLPGSWQAHGSMPLLRLTKERESSSCRAASWPSGMPCPASASDGVPGAQAELPPGLAGSQAHVSSACAHQAA